MLSPFYSTIDLNVSNIKGTSETNLNKDVSIPEKYFNNFPYLIKYQISPTDSTHFETLLMIIRDLFTDEKKKNDPDLNDLFTLFVKIMPKYQRQLNFKLSTKIIETMASKNPDIVSEMYSKNPGIFPSTINSPLFEIIREVNNVENQKDEYSANRLFAQISNSINANTAQHYTSIFASIVSHKHILEMTTPAIVTFIEKALKISPVLLFKASFPNSHEIIQYLTPITLLSSRDLTPNTEIVATLNLCHYVYNLITALNFTENLQNALNLHRFINSGPAAVDAFNLAICAFPEFFDIIKQSRQGFKSIISACLACVISCFELPSLKTLIQQKSTQICDLLIDQMDSTTDTDSALLYQTIIGSIYGAKYTPMTILIQNWLGNRIPMMYVALSLDHNDELFAPIITECAAEIAKDCHLACDFTRKLLCSGPTPAAKHAIRAIAANINSKTLLLFINEGSPLLFVPGVFLLKEANQKLNVLDATLGKAFVQLVLQCVSSESAFAVASLEFLSNAAVDLPDPLHIQLVTSLSKKAGPRAFLRFLLMVTSAQNFARFLLKSPKVASLFIQHLASVVRPAKRIQEVATVAVAWRNMCVNFQSADTFQQKSIFELFTFGTTAVITWAAQGLATDIITAAICDVMRNPVVRPFLVEKVRGCVKNSQEWERARKSIVKCLAMISPADVLASFPSVKGYESVGIPVFPNSMWKHRGWVQLMTCHVTVIK